MCKCVWVSLYLFSQMVMANDYSLSTSNKKPVNPMQPVQLRVNEATVSSTKELQLESILISKQRKVAIINGQFFRIGQPQQGIEVVHIMPTQVTVKYNGEQIDLALLKSLPEKGRE